MNPLKLDLSPENSVSLTRGDSESMGDDNKSPSAAGSMVNVAADGTAANSVTASSTALDARAKAKKPKTVSRYKEEKHIAFILIALSFGFVSCQMLKIFPNLHEQMWCVSAKDCVLRGIGNVIIRMTHLYVCANSTLNFFIYSVNGKRFRRAWKKKFGARSVAASCRRRTRRLSAAARPALENCCAFIKCPKPMKMVKKGKNVGAGKKRDDDSAKPANDDVFKF